MDGNPLLPSLLAVLRQHPGGIKEYDLLAAVRDHPVFSALADDGYLALFQKHFLLMNGLYQLQSQLWRDQRQILTISPLRIQLSSAEGCDSTLPDDSAPSALTENVLKDYYLDWSNLSHTAEQDIRRLLDDFWKRFAGIDAKQDALDTLGLDGDISPQRIRERYRQLAAEHHPDKGGDAETFIKIREAYEVLKVTAK